MRANPGRHTQTRGSIMTVPVVSAVVVVALLHSSLRSARQSGRHSVPLVGEVSDERGGVAIRIPPSSTWLTSSLVTRSSSSRSAIKSCWTTAGVVAGCAGGGAAKGITLLGRVRPVSALMTRKMWSGGDGTAGGVGSGVATDE